MTCTNGFHSSFFRHIADPMTDKSNPAQERSSQEGASPPAHAYETSPLLPSHAPPSPTIPTFVNTNAPHESHCPGAAPVEAPNLEPSPPQPQTFMRPPVPPTDLKKVSGVVVCPACLYVVHTDLTTEYGKSISQCYTPCLQTSVSFFCNSMILTLFSSTS